MRDLVTQIFFRCGYFVVLAAFLLWLRSILAHLASTGFSTRGFLRRERFSLIVSAILTLFVCLAVGAKFRVLSDEAVLTMVGKSMFHFKAAYLPFAGKMNFGKLTPLEIQVPNRPLLYPFFISLAYTLGGERMSSVFAVNVGVLFALLATAMIIVRRYSGPLVALGIACLLLSHPILIYSARSAGFDLLACLYFSWSLLGIAAYLRNPGPTSFAVAWMTLVVFAQVRYESFALIPIAGVVLVVFKAIRRIDLTKNAWILALTPLFFFPHIAQQYLIDNHTRDFSPEAGFSTSHFLDNSRTLIESLLGGSSILLPYNRLLLVIGALCCLDLAWRLTRGKLRIPKGPWRPFWAIAIIGALFFNGVYISHFRGGFLNPSEARFFNLLCLCSVYAMAIHQFLRMPEFWRPSFLAASGTVLIWFAAVSIGQRQTNILTLPRETERIAQILGPPGDHPPMIIAERPVNYLALGYGAVSFGFASSHSSELLAEAKRALIPSLLVLQRVEYETGLPSEGMVLPADFALETIDSFQTADGYLSRLSRVLGSGVSR